MVALSLLISEYLSRNHRISWSTQEMAKRAFRYLIEAIGDIEVEFLSFAHAEDYQSHLISSRGLSKVSTNSMVKSASPVISWAVRRGMLSKNPFDELRPFKVKTKLHIYSDAEVFAILAAAHSEMWLARCLAAVSAGLRRGELLNLRWSDIDFENGSITVQSHEDTASGWRFEPKGREKRTVPLIPRLNNLLVIRRMQIPIDQEYPFLPERRYWTLRQRIGDIPERVLACPDENFSRPFQRILRRAGVKGTFHDLRRTCIKKWSQAGLPPEDVQALAGHSDYKTTLAYYLPTGTDYLDRARAIGATGLEPATS
jgi:integrase